MRLQFAPLLGGLQRKLAGQVWQRLDGRPRPLVHRRADPGHARGQPRTLVDRLERRPRLELPRAQTLRELTELGGELAQLLRELGHLIVHAEEGNDLARWPGNRPPTA